MEPPNTPLRPSCARREVSTHARSTPSCMRSASTTSRRTVRSFSPGLTTGAVRGVTFLSELGVTKQAVSQVVDILVIRGYLDRSPDREDSASDSLELTDRGRQVVDAVVRGVDAVDHELQEHVSREQIDAMRSVLLALTEIKASSVVKGTGKKRPTRQFRKFSPIFPVTDLARALVRYADLGFVTTAYEEGDEYGFADREGAGLHLAADSQADPHARRVDISLCSRRRCPLRGVEPSRSAWPHPSRRADSVRTARGLAQRSDGNLIRFGSPMEQ